MRMLPTLALLALLLATAACQEDLEDISQVSKFRVLAVQTEPPEVMPGENVELTVLTADPEGGGRAITALGFAVPGLITPSSTEVEEDIPLFWVLDPTTAFNGAISLGSVGVPADAAQYVPPDEDGVAGQLKVTALILVCAGDGLDEASLMVELAQLSSGIDPSSGMSLDLASICVAAGADEGLTALKTFSISNRPAEDPYRNRNPLIDGILFDEQELHTAADGGHGVFQCASSDGCRKGVPIEAWLTDDSYQQYQTVEFDEVKVVDERTYISWFTDGGKFSADRSGSNDPLGPYEVDWRPPREGGAFTIWAVAHDIRGGVSWKIYSVEAIPP